MTHVFISYARENQDYARRLADDIRKHGFDVWIDDRLEIGDRWFNTIEEAIETCKAFVVVMTPQARASEWVQKEILIAQRENKRIFPVLLKEKPFGILIDLQHVDVSRGEMPPDVFYERLATVANRSISSGVFVTPSTATSGKPLSKEPPKSLMSQALNYAAAISAVVTLIVAVYLLITQDEKKPSLAQSTATVTETASPTETVTKTASPTKTATHTPTSTRTASPTPSLTPTETLSPTPEITITPIPELPIGGGTGRLAFETVRDINWDIYVMDVTGRNAENLSRSLADHRNPIWSPDGTQLAYQTFQRTGGVRNWEIFVMNADGSDPHNITNNTNEDLEPDWSPDGSQIVFNTARTNDGEIFLSNADGGDPFNVTNIPGTDSDPRWSPLGDWVVFTSHRDGNLEIYKLDPGTGEQIRLTDSSTDDYDATWTRDAQQIIFVSNRGGDSDLYIMDVEGQNVRLLYDSDGVEFDPTVSPDGQWIAFTSDLDGDYEIYLIDIEGENLKQLTFNSVDDRSPTWQPLPK